MRFNRFDVVVVPFPFTDREQTKRRPALILTDAKTFNSPAGHSIMAMITSAGNTGWPMDVEIGDLTAAGLSAPSLVRMKLFTLDHRLVIRTAGTLAPADCEKVATVLEKAFGLKGNPKPPATPR